jgi:hypothetical protein
MTRDDSLSDGFKHRLSPVVGFTPRGRALLLVCRLAV